MSAGAARVVLIGGTSDAREIARELAAAGFEVTTTTLTGYGAELAGAAAAGSVRAGALDAAGLAELSAGGVAIVDASHPFASQVSKNAREAARLAGVAYVRFEREGAAAEATGPGGRVVVAETPEEAAAAAVEAAGPGGTVLLTVGSRTLGAYVVACREAQVRCVARVLPVPESLTAAEAAGLAPADIIAMQGPASVALDTALLEHLSASVLVTKDSGDAGGVPAKLEAARRAGAVAVVIARPAASVPDAVRSVAETVERVRSLAGCPTPAAVADDTPASTTTGSGTRARTGLVHVYTGNGKGKTSAGVGLAVRAAGAGLRVAFVQFVKGGRESSELASLRSLGIEVIRPAQRPTGLLGDGATDEDRAAASATLDAARGALAGAYDLVVMDEACVAAGNALVDAAELAAVVAARASHVEAVLTGRGAPDELLGIADYVTEMRLVAHPYYRGVKARRGVEY